MKRFSSPDSLGSLIYPPQENKNQKNNVIYSREFQAMLDGFEEEDSTEENTRISEKKRRLSYDQVKKLEKIFEVDDKLEPDRKVKLAEELGLQQRQIAIWFQNRRARWKTKQLERDYNTLKANYEDLKLNFDKRKQEKEILLTELRELKLKLAVKSTEQNDSIQEKTLFLETEHNVSKQSKANPAGFYGDLETTNMNFRFHEDRNFLGIKGLGDFKDGLSDSDSRGILNFGHLRHRQQFGSLEEEGLITKDESCNVHSVDQASKFRWC